MDVLLMLCCFKAKHSYIIISFMMSTVQFHMIDDAEFLMWNLFTTSSLVTWSGKCGLLFRKNGSEGRESFLLFIKKQKLDCSSHPL